MYEASFGLKRRPFAATPDATCFLSSDPIRAALDEIVVCVEHGQGIAVMTAPAGTGKTLLCERLRCELDDRFETVFLRHSSFLTRRALLQTILCELNSPYHHPSEQELRLELFPAIRALQPKRESLVLICDEAHLLSDSLLEELRILADFAESGRPLVRLVLVGQLSLEDTLTRPSLDAFNQRIRAHVSLSTFDYAGSLDYIDYRLTWAGGRTDETFTPAALDLIAKVSDGIPRCINQLADHTLLLAFVAEQRPAGEELVREALSDLRQLPLHWNEPPQSLSSTDSHDVDRDDQLFHRPTQMDHEATDALQDSSTSPTFSYETASGFEEHLQLQNDSAEAPADASPLISHDFATYESTALHETNHIDMASDDWRHTLELFNSPIPISELAGSYAQPANKTSIDSSDDFAHFIDVSEIPFQEVLNEAYAAAASASAHVSDNQDPISHKAEDHLKSAQSASDFQDTISERTEAASNQTQVSTLSHSQNSASDFQEEIIVDRYAAIDAGFEPPASPPTDTSKPKEVHSVGIQVDQLQFESLVTSTHGSAVDPIVSSNSGPGEFDEHEPAPAEEVFSPFAKRLTPDCTPDENRDFETISEDVDYGIQSIQTADSSGFSSDSLLEEIRREVDDLAASVGHQSNEVPLDDSVEIPWASVETPQPQSQAETRPFRYLFSKLRRKQQGLS